MTDEALKNSQKPGPQPDQTREADARKQAVAQSDVRVRPANTMVDGPGSRG